MNNIFLIIAPIWFIGLVIVNYTAPVFIGIMLVGLFVIAICAFFTNKMPKMEKEEYDSFGF